MKQDVGKCCFLAQMEIADGRKTLAARRWSQLQVTLPTLQCNDCGGVSRRSVAEADAAALSGVCYPASL